MNTMEQKKAKHVPKKKLNEVKLLKDYYAKYNVVAVADVETLPADQFQKIKHKLKGKIVTFVGSKSSVSHALKELGVKEIDNILSGIRGLPVVMFTNEDSFKLFSILKKGKSKAAAKVGQIAPFDLVLKAGPTPFTPGPMIGELGILGIKTMVQEGKINIREDKVLVKQGEVINQKASELLNKFGIQPMEVGLNLVKSYDKKDNFVYDASVLSIDEKEYLNKFMSAYLNSYLLSKGIGYITKDNIKDLIVDAARNSRALAKSKSILTDENTGEVLSSVESIAQELKNKLNL